MLEDYFSLLIKAIELIAGTRTHLKNRKEGCKGLYRLYLILDEILDESLDMRRELSDTLREDRHIEHVYTCLDHISNLTGRFAGQLFEVRHPIGIFDESLVEDLTNLLGSKCLLLLCLCSYSSFIKKEEKKKFLLKIRFNLEKLRSLPIPPPILKEFSESSLLVEKEYIPFDDKESIEKILQSVDKNIKQLRGSQQHLADFIKENCTYNGLF